MNVQGLANFIWGVADTLRGDYKQASYGQVILPFTVLRRLDCVLDATKENVLNKYESIKSMNEDAIDKILNKESGYNFHNRSKFDLQKLLAEHDKIAINLRNYVAGFSADAREILDKFKFDDQISFLDDKNLLFLVLEAFAKIDLHPDKVSSTDMGYIFEELIRKFAEISNETSGEHFTPREDTKLSKKIKMIFFDNKQVRQSPDCKGTQNIIIKLHLILSKEILNHQSQIRYGCQI